MIRQDPSDRILQPLTSPGKTQASSLITDCHVHIQPFELLLNPPALELMKKHQPDFDRVLEFTRSPAGLNAMAADYAKANPRRLLSCGSFHPRYSTNPVADIDEIVRLGLRLIKIHPPHQLFYPNDYLNGMKELELLYGAAQSNGIPIM